MGLEDSKSEEEIKEEYVALWQSVFDEVVAKFGASVEFGVSREAEAMNAEILKIQMIDKDLNVIGEIEFKPLNRNAIYIEHSHTSEDHLREGIYTALLAKILLKYPGTKTILGYFADTNLKIYISQKKDGKSQDEAIKETPAFKAHSKLGFSKIESRDSKLICHRDY